MYTLFYVTIAKYNSLKLPTIHSHIYLYPSFLTQQITVWQCYTDSTRRMHTGSISSLAVLLSHLKTHLRFENPLVFFFGKRNFIVFQKTSIWGKLKNYFEVPETPFLLRGIPLKVFFRCSVLGIFGGILK